MRQAAPYTRESRPLESVLSRVDLRGAPLALPALGVALGAWLAFQLRTPSVASAVLLAALALALPGRHVRRAAAGLGVGLLAATVQAVLPGRDAGHPARGAAAAVVGEVSGHWGRDEDGWWARLQAETLRQGRRVVPWREQVVVHLPGAEPPLAARRLRLRGHLRRSPGLGNPVASPPGPWRMWIKSRALVEALPQPAGILERCARAARHRVEAALGVAPAGSRGAALSRALLLGDAGALPASWVRGLRRSGLAHLLAVSGLHVGLVAGIALLAGAWLPHRGRLVGAAVAVLGYLLVVGPRPSLLRATLMALLATGALLSRRPPQVANALAAAVAGLLLVQPALIRDLGFRLTVLATAGLVFLAPALAERWRLLPRPLARALAATAAAQLATLPATLPVFHLLAPSAPLWNLLAIPWTAAALAGCVAWTALAALHPEAARATVGALDLLAAPFGWPAALPAALSLPVPLPMGVAGAGGVALALGAALWWPRRGLAAAALLAVACAAGGGAAPERTEVVVLDVGQGDAVVVRDGDRAFLVDGGGWRRGDIGGRVLAPNLVRLGIRRLDAAVLTHPDLDHCRGLADLVAYLPVAEVITASGWERSSCARELLGAPGLRIRPLWAGRGFQVGTWRVTALHPPPGGRGGGNDRSLVLLAEARGSRLLLTGDIGTAVEATLARGASRERLRCDILKVAHHGSRGSSSSAFLAAARPRLAVISAGAGNLYGHPAPGALARLAGVGSRVLRTDRDGAVRVEIGPRGRLRVAAIGPPT